MKTEKRSQNDSNIILVDGDELMTAQQFQEWFGSKQSDTKREEDQDQEGEAVMIEGDMMVTKEQLENRFLSGRQASLESLERRDGLANPSQLWPDGTIPYRILTDSDLRGHIMDAIVDWETYTCLRFNPWTSGSGVSFESGCGGCRSWIGYTGNLRDYAGRPSKTLFLSDSDANVIF